MSQREKLLNKLLKDESFILWIYTNNDSNWSAWIENNQDKKDVVDEARRRILPMKFKSERLSKEKIDYLKNNIDDNIILMENQDSTGRILWNSWIKRAAVILLFASLVSVMIFILNNEEKSAAEIVLKHTEKSTHPGQKLTTYLPDGSKVILNSSSKIVYMEPFSEEERYIRLEGEAFFDVARDTLKPFKVISNGIITTALGTSFNINCWSEDKVEVSLVSGRVEVRNESGKTVILNPGEIAIANNSEAIDISEFDYLERIAWKDGILVFNNASFPEITKKLNDWYGVTIQINRSVDEDFHFTGKYDNHTLNQVLQGISFVQDFDFTMKGDIVEIKFN